MAFSDYRERPLLRGICQKRPYSYTRPIKKCPLPDDPVIEAAKKDENVAAFLSFSPVYRWELREYNNHYEVRFTDLRYRSKGYYPFVAAVQLDRDLNIVSSYTGWIFSEGKLRKKLDLIPN